MNFGDVSVDYGEQGPEHFDRFGVRHYARVETHSRIREYMDANPRAIVKRLGLTLSGWYKRWPGMEVFHLQIEERPLEIRSYSDGRIKLFLDGAPVYTENTRIVTRHGVKHREIEQWLDPAAETIEDAEDQRQKRLDAVRAKLERKT